MQTEGSTTRILIVDSDETSFEIRQCIARALEELPPIELFHARDATEALALLETLAPDVVVIDDDEPGERDLFIDSLATDHPPIVLCTDDLCAEQSEAEGSVLQVDREITYIPKSETLEGFHQTLKLAAAIGMKFTGEKENPTIH